MQLMFVSHTNEDGENMDLFVQASSAREASELWHKYFGWAWGDLLGTALRIIVVPTPEITDAHAIPWAAVDQVFVAG